MADVFTGHYQGWTTVKKLFAVNMSEDNFLNITQSLGEKIIF
jgi:hypothetical protein